MIVVSGLERSGTSLMMQILEDAGYDVCYDDSRKPDIHNPKGYYELYDGKIILELMENRFDPTKYNGKVIKITSYGIDMLDPEEHKFIYMTRDIKEVYESQKKMMNNSYRVSIPYMDEIRLLEKMNERAIGYLKDNNSDYIIINFNSLINAPREELDTLSKFLGKDIRKSLRVIDKKLYRNRRN